MAAWHVSQREPVRMQVQHGFRSHLMRAQHAFQGGAAGFPQVQEMYVLSAGEASQHAFSEAIQASERQAHNAAIFGLCFTGSA